MKMPKSFIGKECSGCAVCVDACPMGAISFVMAGDSFLYPKVDESKCVSCGACRTVCQGVHGLALSHPLDCIAAVAKDQSVFLCSSSGGAFSIIVKALSAKNKNRFKRFFVVGAAYDRNLRVHHKIVEYRGSDSLNSLRSSKYVQSDTTGIYKRVKGIIADTSDFVIFSGTPCQVAGLLSFLGGTRENLFCIDLICKGAPSQKVFDKYISDLAKTFKSQVVSCRFRCKEQLDNGTFYTRSVRIELADGRVMRMSRLEDDFLRMFYSPLPKFRDACRKCRFKDIKRVGDMTIGDAWGVDKVYPQLKAVRGVSLILPITKRAEELIDLVQTDMNTYPCHLDDLTADNSFAPLPKGGGVRVSNPVLKVGGVTS